MSSLDRKLNQTATYWAPGVTDVYGKRSYSAPVQLQCRWEDRHEMIMDKVGQEAIAKSRVFFAEDLELDGYLFLGCDYSDDPTAVVGAYEIRQIARVPNLRNLSTLYTVYL